MSTTDQKKLSERYDIEAMLDGKIPPPGFEPCSLEKMALTFAAGGGVVVLPTIHRFKHPDITNRNHMHPSWARYMLSYTQGGYPDGSGYVTYYELQGGQGAAFAGTFKFCEHQFIRGAGYNEMRGWRPGHCGKCGLDMSVDSGD